MKPRKFGAKRLRPSRLRRNHVEMREEAMQIEKRLFKLSEAGIILNMSYNTLRAKIRDGVIRVVRDPLKRGASLRGAAISAEEIDRYIAAGSAPFARPA